MSIQIIRADLDNSHHAKALISLLEAYAQGPMAGSVGLTEFTKKNLIAELNKRPYIVVLLAMEKEQVVGFLNAIEGFSTFACRPLMNIHDVFVLPKYRGQGIATQLFQSIENHAQSKGCCKMTLEVLEENTIAQSAYRNFGYQPSNLDLRLGNTFFWEKKLG
jgi:ribosomal protein S18 acetylase RimI-like enzyme